ncbi:MLP-like protein 328 [Alnus glutinosa]|uniref:MLP-like protein 328 n=1 Tax=Alnus glutinosa TaxID=3517 RepID=UPI002D79F927|nr:MLP-like protein 328 [Alnus glutinosa]
MAKLAVGFFPTAMLGHNRVLKSVLGSENHQLPNASPDKVHGVEVHEGDWKTTGSVKLWKYTVEGEVEVMKEKVEVDEEKKLVILTALDGHCLNLYKSYKIIFQVTPKSEGGSVKITLDYEKLNGNIPPPNKYLDLIVNLIKDLDAHILKPCIIKGSE